MASGIRIEEMSASKFEVRCKIGPRLETKEKVKVYSQSRFEKRRLISRSSEKQRTNEELGRKVMVTCSSWT
jgi:hypothetical protein